MTASRPHVMSRVILVAHRLNRCYDCDSCPCSGRANRLPFERRWRLRRPFRRDAASRLLPGSGACALGAATKLRMTTLSLPTRGTASGLTGRCHWRARSSAAAGWRRRSTRSAPTSRRLARLAAMVATAPAIFRRRPSSGCCRYPRTLRRRAASTRCGSRTSSAAPWRRTTRKRARRRRRRRRSRRRRRRLATVSAARSSNFSSRFF